MCLMLTVIFNVNCYTLHSYLIYINVTFLIHDVYALDQSVLCACVRACVRACVQNSQLAHTIHNVIPKRVSIMFA